MKILVIAIGQKMPAWCTQACEDYLKRFPSTWPVELKALKAEDRGSRPVQKIMHLEADRIRAAIPKDSFLVILDERGSEFTSEKFAKQINKWASLAATIVFVVGGADGIDNSLKSEANATVRLSSMTLPHALARVFILEQLYRGWSLLHNHPYHRA